MDMAQPNSADEGWIETISGRRFNFKNTHPDEIHIEDIATVLPRLCRYNGHTRRWYSVAEHACLLSDWVMEQGGTALDGLTALHHDNAEYIIGDLPSPIKAGMSQFKEVEAQIECAMAEKFNTIWPLPPWLKEADTRILKDERQAVMNPSKNDWGIDGLEELGVRFMPICGRSTRLMRWQWLRRHHRLTAKMWKDAQCAGTIGLWPDWL